MKKVIEFDQECSSCVGTGLYVGMAERDGAAVVCHTCKGTGKEHFKHSYQEFDGRKAKQGVKRVYQANPGIGLGEGVSKRGEVFALSDFGGMPYKDWQKTGKFPPRSEMRRYTCPAWWYQSVDYKKKPNWDECIGCGSFSDCESFKTKEKCWERWDKEFGSK